MGVPADEMLGYMRGHALSYLTYHLPSSLHFQDEAIVIVSVNLSLSIGNKGSPQINFKRI